MRRVRTALIGLSTTAALVAGFAPGATALTTEDGSTPVPIATPEGQISAYIVNVGKGRTDWGQAHRAVDAAEGTVVQDWPQIGVIVVHSTNGDFRTDLASTSITLRFGLRQTLSNRQRLQIELPRLLALAQAAV